jgi:hypothetical protein
VKTKREDFMKHSFAGLILSIALMLVLSSLPKASLYGGSINPDATLLEVTLREACHCTEIPSQLDPSVRPILAPQLDPTILPVDVSLPGNSKCFANQRACQTCFDCFAWQLFVALNWPAAGPGRPNPAAEFGLPDNSESVVWETFKSADDIFNDPNLKDLPPWEQNDRPRTMTAALRKNLAARQADYNWLTDREGNLVWYEIKVNQDEYEYIRRNHLYNQEGLFAAFNSASGLNLPNGPSQDGRHGAIEIKAAWRRVPQNKLDEYKSRFKISYAKIRGDSEVAPLALVGLHIIKKTPNSPQFVWATFEHRDNAPDSDSVAENRQWSFYDRGLPENYTPSWSHPPGAKSNRNIAVQVKRIAKIDDQAESINDAMHKLIARSFPQSVWLNYVLVNVQWPASPKPRPFDVAHTLPLGDPTPASVANTTMETYMQEKNSGGHGRLDATHLEDGPSSCIGCHRHAAITPSFAKTVLNRFPKPQGNTVWWTDYSTIFFRAKAKDPAR